MPTAADGSGRRRAGEGELDDRVNADGSATGDETRSDTQIFEDTASHQISDDDDSSLDSIRAEKLKMAERDCYGQDERTWEPPQDMKDKALLIAKQTYIRSNYLSEINDLLIC